MGFIQCRPLFFNVIHVHPTYPFSSKSLLSLVLVTGYILRWEGTGDAATFETLKRVLAIFNVRFQEIHVCIYLKIQP